MRKQRIAEGEARGAIALLKHKVEAFYKLVRCIEIRILVGIVNANIQ